MRLSNICLIIFLLGAIVFPSAYAASAPVNNNASTSTNHSDLVSFVDKAMTYAKANGKEKAIAEINNSKGEFINGSLYIFAVDFNGVVLAHPKRPDFVGKNQLGMQDTMERPSSRTCSQRPSMVKALSIISLQTLLITINKS